MQINITSFTKNADEYNVFTYLMLKNQKCMKMALAYVSLKKTYKFKTNKKIKNDMDKSRLDRAT